MSNSREESPDWLRSYQAPTSSIVSLSSPSKSSPDDSPSRVEETNSSPRISLPLSARDDGDVIVLDEDAGTSVSKKDTEIKSGQKQLKIEYAFSRKKKANTSSKTEAEQDGNKVDEGGTSKKHVQTHALDHSVMTLSSDSEPCSHDSPVREQKTSQSKPSGKDEHVALIGRDGEPSTEKAQKEKSPRKRQLPKKENFAEGNMKTKEKDAEMEIAAEETSDKPIMPYVSTSRLPLVLPEKVNRTKALVECEGESIDLSGDMGAVGRVVISDTSSGSQEMYLDLKGTLYKATIVPSRTFCVVSVGQSEAKIEAIMNDFIQLKPQSNVYESETMVEGTLEGFSFDSEDETDRIPKVAPQQTDQSEGIAEQTNVKAKGKTEKASGPAKKRGRAAAKEKAPPAKKARKKTAASKKTKGKK